MNTTVRTLNGKNLYFLFLAGSKKILEHQREINRINVFPVPDGDTGTNLASTLRSIIDNIQPHQSFKITADNIAFAALEGARGNSGIIFAQFLHGLSSETGNHHEITIEKFSDSVKNSIKYIYEAVANPVEGTMLTVIREWAEHIHHNLERIQDFKHLLHDSYKAAKQSLSETTKKLKILARSNVVDAGAKGFVLFLEGILEYLKDNNIREILSISQAIEPEDSHMEEISPEMLTYRYCTEALIKGDELDKKSIRKIAEEFGDSLVVAGSEKHVRLHIHTDSPADLFENLRCSGTLSYQKAEDMYKQYQVAHDRKYDIALVTDSTCDLPDEFLDKYQIHQVPINIHIGENIYLDKLTLDSETFYNISEEYDVIPTTSQPNETSFVNLYSFLASHYDFIIAIHLSSKFSGTWSSSSKAAKRVEEEMDKRITVIDSRSISGSLGLIVQRVAESIEAGMDYDEIIRKIEDWKSGIGLYISVRSMKNLVRSGRVSPLKGWLAKLLNLKPVIAVGKDGTAVLLDKAFSQEGNIRKVLKHIKRDISENKLWNYVIVHALNPETAKGYASLMEDLTGRKPLLITSVCPALVLHAGLGTVAVGMLPE
ncbi:MAG: DegV family EDD domain-containing protein [Bacteroidales bacterium]|nr:MAG: DegV family EDD domain-containing protein [Bacteroidales bacterium]